MDEPRENMFLEHWIQAEMRADRLQEQVDILTEKLRFMDQKDIDQLCKKFELLAEAHNEISALRSAIQKHRRTIDSPASPELAGIVDRTLWAILDIVPDPFAVPGEL